MSFRTKKRTTDSARIISDAVKAFFDCAVFSPVAYQINPQKDTQISLLGEICGHSSSVNFNEEKLAETVPAYNRNGQKLFSVMCGETKQKNALIYSVLDTIKAGSLKNIIVTESVSERDDIADSFDLICSFIPEYNVYVYLLDSYDAESIKSSETEISSFITDSSPAVLIIGRDSLCRNDNLINRSEGGISLSKQIANIHPVVFTVSDTVDSARSVASASRVFSPSVTVMFSKEVKNIKSPVIYPLQKNNEAGNGQLELAKKTK